MNTYQHNKKTRTMQEKAAAYIAQKQAIQDKDTVVIVGDRNRNINDLTDLFDKLGVKYSIIKSKYRSRETIIEMIKMSPDGFDTIVSPKSPLYNTFMDYVEDASFNDAVDFILEYPRVLNTVIAFNSKVLVTGTRIEEVGVFFPKEYKDVIRKINHDGINEIAMSHIDDVYTEDFSDKLVHVEDYLEDYLED